MKKLFFTLTGFLLILITSCGSLNAQFEYFYGGEICNEEDWVLVFEDEFNGNEINTDIWYTYQPYGLNENDDQCPNCRTHFFPDGDPSTEDDNEVYLDKNIRLDDGKLYMGVYQENYTFHDVVFPFTSCQLFSKESFPNYARYEIKCKMPIAHGLLRSFWVHGWGSEIDIFETWEPDVIMTTMHHNGNGCSSFTNLDIDPDEFHVYRVDYEKYYIKFYIDDTLYQVKPRYVTSVEGLNYECELSPGYYQKQNCYPADWDKSPMNIILGPSVGNWITEFFEPGVDPQLVSEWEIDWVRLYEKCGDFDDLVVGIGEEITITGNHSYNNISINENGVLNIENAEIKMNIMSRINVNSFAQLNISNSTITSTCSDKWEGIYGWWESSINLSNDSYIENARKAITLFNSSYADLTNTTIQNCDIGFLLKSIEKDCNIFNVDFKNNITAIRAEESNGITISYSKFSDNHYGITSFESFLDIKEGNLFIDNVKYNISIDGTFPTSSGSYIGKVGGVTNRFINGGSYGGITCRGSDHPVSVQIKNNLFSDGHLEAITLVGENAAIVSNNRFQNCNSGVSFFSIGGNENKLNCNIFEGAMYYNNLFSGDNKKTTFLGNQSSGLNWYNYVLADDNASVKEFIGSFDNPAANCFSNNNYTTDIETYLNGNTPFTYFYHDNGTTDNCEEPINPGNYNPISRLKIGSHCGGNIGPFDIIDPDGDGNDGIDTFIIACCMPDILDSVDIWINIVIDDGGDNPKTTIDERINPGTPELVESEEILDQWINFGIYAAIETENYEFAEQLLTPLVTMRWQKRLYGIKVRQKKYNEANAILESLPQNNQEQIYFKNVQDINLKRFTGIESGIWTIDETDIALLKTISESKYPAKGYANSLYTKLTGEFLPIQIPSVSRGLEGREASSYSNKAIKAQQTIYPNPASDEINIKLGDDVESMIVEIYNIIGEKVISKTVNSSYTKIDISKLETGVYLISILKSDETKLNKKVYIK